MPPRPIDLLQGTLDLMILKAVSWHSMHGYAIARWIQQVTDDVLRVEEGSLYPALHRLEDKGLVAPSWGLSENKRQAKFYALTAEGRRTLRADAASWLQYAAAITKVVTATRQPA
ncbi:MAG TPA: PadR family transcriptional regulator [Acidimicrobiales bacterium]|nr:PadR family transcriptional regulator [Acidimicrobiales bacterium]